MSKQSKLIIGLIGVGRGFGLVGVTKRFGLVGVFMFANRRLEGGTFSGESVSLSVIARSLRI